MFYRNLLLLIAALSLLAIFILDIHFVFQLMLVLFLMLLLKHAWAGNHALELHRNAQGEWQLLSKHQGWHAQLLADSVVTPLFAILQFKLEGAGRRSVVIFPDSLPHDSFRRLRVCLKVEGIQPVQHDTLG
jgi:hypothetical protein